MHGLNYCGRPGTARFWPAQYDATFKHHGCRTSDQALLLQAHLTSRRPGKGHPTGPCNPVLTLQPPTARSRAGSDSWHGRHSLLRSAVVCRRLSFGAEPL